MGARWVYWGCGMGVPWVYRGCGMGAGWVHWGCSMGSTIRWPVRCPSSEDLRGLEGNSLPGQALVW
eukprot:1618732-Pyramimonas_sp.AAC.1